MSDLSQPERAALAAVAADSASRVSIAKLGQKPDPSSVSKPSGVLWPAPDIGGYPVAPGPFQCRVEGLNGQALQGELVEFDAVQGLIHLRLPSQRKPQPVRMTQFRRLQVVELLKALPSPPDARDLESEQPGVPFRVEFDAVLPWAGRTMGHRDEPCGLFLFEPVDAAASVRRWFVPRSAYRNAEVGLRIGDALVEMHSATPEQIRLALAEQETLRSRKLGEMLVVRQIITADELAAAVEQQSRMPMVRIGEALTALGIITAEQLTGALQQQRADRGVPLGELMVRNGMVTRSDLQTALARKMGYPLVDVLKFTPDPDAVARVPYALAARLPALPLMMRAGRLVTAVEDPTNHCQIDELQSAAKCKIAPVLARSDALRGAIDHAYAKTGTISELRATLQMGEPLDRVDDHFSVEPSDHTLEQLVNSMIVEAHEQGVSDIHIECAPGTEQLRIRFRRDGRLRPHLELPPTYGSALIARLKFMCDLDVSEKRQPQDGKIAFSKFVPGVKLELRLATIPTHGDLEDAVLRLMQPREPIAIGQLGLSPANLKALRTAAERPQGLLLCAGPTGSGTTTTLHAVLASIHQPDRKIWTAEDPIEITQPGLRQVQVDPRTEGSFAKAVRSFLRADADVIMVGEIRDDETAKAAIEAALSGHLVLSTLHTPSAPETVTRLLDMGMNPFNVADALLSVLAQRTVRRLCLHCRTSRDASAEEQDELLHDHLQATAGIAAAPKADDVLADWKARFGVQGRLQRWHSPGCEHCGPDGLHGRAGIQELMRVTRPMRHLIQTGASADELQRQALGDGMRTLQQDGIEKVLAGVTTMAEVRAIS